MISCRLEYYVRGYSFVGLIPLFAVETLEPGICNRLEGFKRTGGVAADWGTYFSGLFANSSRSAALDMHGTVETA